MSKRTAAPGGAVTEANGSAAEGTTRSSAEEASGAPAGGRGRLAPMGRVFAVVAFLEAFTWAGLLLGMALKYGPVGTEAVVWLFGRLHGGVFMFYLGVTLVSAWQFRWKRWVTVIALAASVPPLVTVPVEMWLRRSGRLWAEDA